MGHDIINAFCNDTYRHDCRKRKRICKNFYTSTQHTEIAACNKCIWVCLQPFGACKKTMPAPWMFSQMEQKWTHLGLPLSWFSLWKQWETYWQSSNQRFGINYPYCMISFKKCFVEYLFLKIQKDTRTKENANEFSFLCLWRSK